VYLTIIQKNSGKNKWGERNGEVGWGDQGGGLPEPAGNTRGLSLTGEEGSGVRV